MVETFDIAIKKWGNSLGAVLPNDIVQKNKLKENDKIRVFIVKKSDILQKNFGRLKGKLKMSGQEAKDMIRKELHHIE